MELQQLWSESDLWPLQEDEKQPSPRKKRDILSVQLVSAVLRYILHQHWKQKLDTSWERIKWGEKSNLLNWIQIWHRLMIFSLLTTQIEGETTGAAKVVKWRHLCSKWKYCNTGVATRFLKDFLKNVMFFTCKCLRYSTMDLYLHFGNHAVALWHDSRIAGLSFYYVSLL